MLSNCEVFSKQGGKNHNVNILMISVLPVVIWSAELDNTFLQHFR